MIALLAGQIIEQTTKPYTWFPWVIVLWIALFAAGAMWLASARPRELERAGGLLAGEESDAPARRPVAVG